MSDVIGGAQAYRDHFDPISYLDTYRSVATLAETACKYELRLRRAHETIQDFILNGESGHLLW